MPLDPNVTVITDDQGRETYVATGGPLAPPAPPAADKPAEDTEEVGDGATEDAADGDRTNSRRRKR